MSQSDAALVLLVHCEEWAARSFESILKPRGYAVLKAYTGQQGLLLAGKIRPDIVMTGLRLPDMTGAEMCAKMRSLPTVRPSTPIVAFSTGLVERRERIEHLKEGVWEVFSPPFDPEEVLVRMDRYLAAKRDVEAVLEQSYVDPLTGLYNLQGVMKRVTELAADAVRSGRDLSCLILSPSSDADDETTPADRAEGNPKLSAEPGPAGHPNVARALAQMMASTTRLSDSIGRIGEADFVIIAPGIDAAGAQRLAERVLEALEQQRMRDDDLGVVHLRAGVYAVQTEHGAEMTPEIVLTHARAALRRAQIEGNGTRIHTFDAK